jgi:hypothetical protein
MSNLELPHELLMRKYNLSNNDLSKNTRQFKMDLDKTLTMIINKSRNGRIQMTPTTQSKIEAYDRAICDGIFEYLENEEVISESQSDSMESQMDAERNETINSFDTTSNTNTSTTPTKTPTTTTTTPTTTTTTSNNDVKIGGWSWE